MRAFSKQFSVLLLCLAFAIVCQSQTFTTLYTFSGNDGANPYGSLTQGTDGNFYGTTIDGGDNGGGNVFRMTPSGSLTSLYSFCAQSNCNDGQYPTVALTEGPDGNFYGVTQSGGTNGGFGTIFKITPGGKLTTLYSFSADDGAAPYGSLLLADNGDFYGTANVGGANNGGNIFKMTHDGTLTILYSFCAQAGCSDGQYPVGPLIQARGGYIYGTTHAGGNTICQNGCGTIFRMTLDGTLTTVHLFNVTDGDYPYGGVVEGNDGQFYGTTGGGGANNWGTVFRINQSGTLTTICSFTGSNGASPYALMHGADGNFYGTTAYGGPNTGPFGSVFKISPSGKLTKLHVFNGQDGKDLFSGLTQGTDGTLYGTTYFGGPNDDGTIFQISLGSGGGGGAK